MSLCKAGCVRESLHHSTTELGCGAVWGSCRVYRIPSLPCAAASAQRSLRSVDLSSTFYSLNPSGDLSSTQSAFQDWFARLHWEVGYDAAQGRLLCSIKHCGWCISMHLLEATVGVVHSEDRMPQATWALQ